jgi:hypothetical protein
MSTEDHRQEIGSVESNGKTANIDDPIPPPATPKPSRQSPSPWLQFFLGLIVLAVSITSATFAGLNYFRSAKTAGIIVDRFEDDQAKISFPGQGEKNFHQLRMWITNLGQTTAKIRNVAISPEFADELMTPAKEAERMAYVAKNKTMIGTTQNGELVTGQKAFYPSHAGYPDELWSAFISKKQLLYVFAVITFADEKSGDQNVMTEVCVRLEPTLNNWNYCSSGHNQTIR